MKGFGDMGLNESEKEMFIYLLTRKNLHDAGMDEVTDWVVVAESEKTALMKIGVEVDVQKLGVVSADVADDVHEGVVLAACEW